MTEKLINVGGHGIGDCLLSLQISHCLTEKGVSHKNLISSREEVFNPLNYIAGKIFELENISFEYCDHNAIETDPLKLKEIKEKFNSSYISYNVPDLLFTNPLSFKYERYGLNLQLIKKTRTLTKVNAQKEKIIYCGLCSNTQGYMHSDVHGILNKIAAKLPDYTIYFPKINKWVNNINYNCDFSKPFLSNVWIDEDPEFNKSLDILIKSQYGIFTCNGPSHLAYHLGIPRLILDPQYNKILWMSRWKEDYEECIPIQIDSELISKLVQTNILVPQTLMLDRKIILNSIAQNYNNWKEILYFKF